MTILKKVITVTVIIFFAGNVHAQWSTDIRLTNNSGESWTTMGKKCIAYSSNVLHVVWFDRRFGDDEIMYKRSTDGGVNWEPVVRLTNSPASSTNPEIAASGNNVFVVWRDFRDGNYEIYFKRSADKGVSWDNDIRLTNNGSYSIDPCIDIYTSVIQVAWSDNRDGNYEIYFKRSTDNGTNWDAVQRITNNASESNFPSINTISNNTILVWSDNRDGNSEIYYNKSTNAGATWGSDARLTNNSANSVNPDVTGYSNGSGYNLYLTWSDYRDGNSEVYFKRSTDNGVSWNTDQRITNDAGISIYPVLDVFGQNLYIVWQDYRAGNYGVYYNRSLNSGLSWDIDLKLNTSALGASAPSICIYNTGLHVVWCDERDNDLEIYYKQNPTGNITSITNTGTEIPENFSLSQNFPNPFNPTTNFEFSIPLLRGVDVPSTRDGGGVFITLEIYDAIGRKIETLVNSAMNPGTYKVEWKASNYNSGVYFYRLTAGSYRETKKMLLVK